MESSCGTADDPKFALLNYFEDLVFEAVKYLVNLGEKFDGYTPIIHEDNAGPRQDTTFKRGLEEYCVRESWKWISQ